MSSHFQYRLPVLNADVHYKTLLFNMVAIHKLHRICLWCMAMCWWVLMLSDVAGVPNAGVQLVEKPAYIGEKSVLLYSIDSDYAEPSLYREPQKLIASWKGTTCTVEYMADDYNGKIYMDKKRNIWMYDVEIKDAGKYYVKFGAKLERPTVNITLNVKGTLTGEQTMQIRKLVDDRIKEHIDSRNQPIMILLVIIIGMITVLYIPLTAGNQIRKGLTNMLGLIKRNLCSQQENENESGTQEDVLAMEQGHLTGEQIRKLFDDYKKDIKESNENLIGQIKVWLAELVVTKPKIPKLSEKVVALPPRSNSVLTGTFSEPGPSGSQPFSKEAGCQSRTGHGTRCKSGNR